MTLSDKYKDTKEPCRKQLFRGTVRCKSQLKKGNLLFDVLFCFCHADPDRHRDYRDTKAAMV